MMARSTNAPFKGRIQKRKTNHLQIITFGLQRTAGPYKGAKGGHHAHDLVHHLAARRSGARYHQRTARHPQCLGPMAVTVHVCRTSDQTATLGAD